MELYPLFPLETSSCVYYGQISYFQYNKWWGGGGGGGGRSGEGGGKVQCLFASLFCRSAGWPIR